MSDFWRHFDEDNPRWDEDAPLASYCEEVDLDSDVAGNL